MALYFSGQGSVYVADRQVTGDAGPFKFLGNCSGAKVTLSTDRTDHKEAVSGQRVIDATLVRQTMAEVTVTMEEFLPDNLAIGLYGIKNAALAGGAITNELFPNPVAVGDFVRTKFPNISALTIKDNIAAALTLDTHYSVISSKKGLIKVLSLGAFTQPFKFNYTGGAFVNLPIFSKSFTPRWLRFEGLNTADGAAVPGELLVELYNVVFEPLAAFDLIADDFAKWELKGKAYYDIGKVADTQLGAYGRVAML